MKYSILLLLVIFLIQNSLTFRVSSPQNELKRNISNINDGNKPIKKYLILTKTTTNNNDSCSSDSSSEFPDFVFNNDQLSNGGVILCFIIGIYFFHFMAIICDKCFIPCVEHICLILNISPDVAAATFMSVATASTETFINVIGTFVTDSDLGIGTITGSLMFNILGVAAIGSLATQKPVQLHWWPLTRDCFFYTIAVFLLIGVTWDGIIYLWESILLCVFYMVYFTLQFQNKRIVKYVKIILKKIKGQKIEEEKPKQDIHLDSNVKKISIMSHHSYMGSYADEQMFELENHPNNIVPTEIIAETIIKKEEEKENESFYKIPNGFWSKLLYFYELPMNFIIHTTMPNLTNKPSIMAIIISFILCAAYTGGASYVVTWMICLIGKVFNIPDSVLGLTFLAAGSCVPEGISLFIMVSRRGEGAFGVSNSLGASTLDVSISLGLPWFIKSLLQISRNQDPFVIIQSGSIEYSIMTLAVGSISLYVTLCLFKFKLRKTVGVILMTIYIGCLIFAILCEMVFFRKPGC